MVVKAKSFEETMKRTTLVKIPLKWVLENGGFDCDDTCGQKFSRRQTLHQMSKVVQTFKGRKPLTNRFPLLCTLFHGFQCFRKVFQIHEAHDFMQYKYINQYFSK